MKKTVWLSRLDATLEVLKAEALDYDIEVIAKVKNRGFNELNKNYFIRKLKYNNKTMLEQMIQTMDKDLDDFFVSYVFYNDKVPKEWIIIRKI